MKEMKKFFIVMLAATMCGAYVYAAADKKITAGELPQAAQSFLKSHFADIDVAYVEMDDDVVNRDYEVVLRDGTKIDFDHDGNWKEVNCFRRSIPAGIVPQQISAYVADNYAGEIINEIERGRNSTEVKLSNGLELKFNKSYQLIEIDR